MKLFLASGINKTLPLLSKVDPELGKKVLFVANAADPYTGDKFWIDWDRTAFRELGYQVHEVDLREITPKRLEQLLKTEDILHICGGSPYYLISLFREKGFEQVIVNAIKNDLVVYTGTSAGSIVVSKNIKSFSHDQEEMEHIKKVPDHRGLGVIDFCIVPHCNNASFVDEHKKIVEHMPNDPEALFFLQDTQAVWIEDNNMRFLQT
ncbi:MAG: Type 1 glutamine amidotransferase-like domain-containing protein [Candidatus Wildermuthbacteria bacterium]|nr:Type 1 glutamine amidotransferase-like domain-containing protein [Candidatus Wildermuthbacteria bacterium]